MFVKNAAQPLIARCVTTAGSPVAGIILYRLKFWKPTREYGGRKWIAKSYAELVEETGLSAKQVETGVAKLRRDGLIQTSQHIFQGRNVMHVLITAKAEQDLLGEPGVPPYGGAQVPPNGGTQEPPNGGASYTAYKQGESHGESHGDSEQVLAESLGSAEMKTKHLSVKDAILAAQVSPKASAKIHKPDAPKALGKTWNSLVNHTYAKFMPELTLKQLGQLKTFANKCPPGRAVAVMSHVVANWITFVKTVEQEAGIKTTPSEPSIAFLLQHAGIAVNLAAPEKPTKPQEAKTVSKPAAKPVQLISQPVEEAPKSFDELMAILNNEDGA